MRRENLLEDSKTIDGVVRNLEILSEAVKNLNSETKKAHPE
ncbi:hypothetical protein BMS3Abin16_01711 [archaeon BMS3Abin16]|nr:hypothetical protein BMS3Abin16_01711 [archaeon BMS3Abin16]GBE56476.1 hypothetical protein BMS3Bbin16_00682 [archaeon BMS3Bbin16]